MVTALYLIRHGETDGGNAQRYHGSVDVPLSLKGREQVQATCRRLSSHLDSWAASKYLSYLRHVQTNVGPSPLPEKSRASQLSAVYCSGLSRASQSADIIAAQFGLVPVVIDDLRERSFGIWEGMTFSEIKEKFPGEFAAWAGNPLDYSPVGAEKTVDVSQRVTAAMHWILDRHRGENIAVVAHGGVNRIILCNILGMPLTNIFRIEQDYAALNIVEFWDRYPVLRLLNG